LAQQIELRGYWPLPEFVISIQTGQTSEYSPRSSGEFAVEQTELLKFATELLDRLGIPYALVGSFASGIWGESRFTQDIDILVRLDSGDVKKLCAGLPATDFYVSEAAALEAVRRYSQFNVIHPASGNKIDFIIVGKDEWSLNQITRRKYVHIFDGPDISVAAPEDVIIGKLIYYKAGGSDKHLRDIAGIIAISNELVDRSYVESSAARLDVLREWNLLLADLEKR
jgi:hypothetical protein